MKDQFLTVKEIAERLRVHPETVRGWLRTGQLAGARLGKRAGFRISEADVQEFLDQRKKRGLASDHPPSTASDAAAAR